MDSYVFYFLCIHLHVCVGAINYVKPHKSSSQSSSLSTPHVNATPVSLPIPPSESRISSCHASNSLTTQDYRFRTANASTGNHTRTVPSTHVITPPGHSQASKRPRSPSAMNDDDDLQPPPYKKTKTDTTGSILDSLHQQQQQQQQQENNSLSIQQDQVLNHSNHPNDTRTKDNDSMIQQEKNDQTLDTVAAPSSVHERESATSLLDISDLEQEYIVKLQNRVCEFVKSIHSVEKLWKCIEAFKSIK